MPLAAPTTRREIHRRTIEMFACERQDGLFEVEARLLDSKPFDFVRPSSPQRPTPAGEFLHDLSIRLVLDGDLQIQDVQAASDTTPWPICKEAQDTLKVLVGQKIGRGWSAIVKEKLRGAASCTHLMEMLLPMASTAIQGIRPLRQTVPALAPQIDTCYAFGREREVVQVLWPRMHGGPGLE